MYALWYCRRLLEAQTKSRQQEADNQKNTILSTLGMAGNQGAATSKVTAVLLGETSKFPPSNDKLFTKCYRAI